MSDEPIPPHDPARIDLRTDDLRWMGVALEEADRAAAEGEVPVGCVLVKGGVEIARAHNRRESSQDPTAHAEVLAIRAAAREVGSWRLEGVTAYVTLEPCAMCAGALVNARVGTLVYGAPEPRTGATESSAPSSITIISGVLATECRALMQQFFQERR